MRNRYSRADESQQAQQADPWSPPGFLFFPRDWFGNTDLQRVSRDARLLLLELMALAWQGSDPGRLVGRGGEPLADADIGWSLRLDSGRVRALLDELGAAGQLHLDDRGALCFPALIEDHRRAVEVRSRRAAGGAKGGRPRRSPDGNLKGNLKVHLRAPLSEPSPAPAQPSSSTRESPPNPPPGGTAPADPVAPNGRRRKAFPWGR